MKEIIGGITFVLLVQLFQCNADNLANRVENGPKRITAAKLTVNKDYVQSHDNAQIPRLGLRFTGLERDEYIRTIVRFVLTFTEIRMIELPEGREKTVIDAWRETNVPRKDIFLVFKLSFRMVGVDDTRNELEGLLRRCGLEYIDLFLIHFLDTKGFYVVTWKTMIDLQRQWKVRYIGVSNALHNYVTFLYKHTGILPSIVQLEVNPFFQQALLTEQFHEMGIAVQGYGIMAAGEKMQEPRLQRIAKKYNITSGQLLVQWCLQKSLSCLVTSSKLFRVAENFHPMNVTISDNDITIISKHVDMVHHFIQASSDVTLEMFNINELEENLVHHFDPFDSEHLQSVDSFIKEKMKVLEADGYWESKSLSNMKHISVAEDYDPSEIENDIDNKQNETANDFKDVSESLPPLYMSSDVDTEITPEVLEIIRQEEKKLKANGLYDEDYKEAINRAYEEYGDDTVEYSGDNTENSENNRHENLPNEDHSADYNGDNTENSESSMHDNIQKEDHSADYDGDSTDNSESSMHDNTQNREDSSENFGDNADNSEGSMHDRSHYSDSSQNYDGDNTGSSESSVNDNTQSRDDSVENYGENSDNSESSMHDNDNSQYKETLAENNGDNTKISEASMHQRLQKRDTSAGYNGEIMESSNIKNRQVESDVFKIEMKDIASTCKQLSRASLQSIIEENERNSMNGKDTEV